jgi:hypothetical protein
MSADLRARFEIRRARNGWILKVEELSSEGSETDEFVHEEKYEDDVECFASLFLAQQELQLLNGPQILGIAQVFRPKRPATGQSQN